MERPRPRPRLRPRLRPQVRIEELDNPECAAPQHEPRGFRFSPKKLMEKLFPKVHVVEVQTHDVVTASSLHNETSQDTLQSEEVAQSPNQAELVQPQRSDEVAPSRSSCEGEINTAGNTCPNGNLTTPTPNHVVQNIAHPTQRDHAIPTQKNGFREFKILLSRFFGSASEQEVSTDVHLDPIVRPSSTLVDAIPVDEPTSHNFASITAIPTQEITVAKRPEQPGITESDAPEKTTISIDGEEHAVWLPIKSSRIYSPEDGVFVGRLHELPPPDVLKEDWHLIKTKLTTNLLQAGRNLPRSVRASQRRFQFEPEFYMSGRALPNKQDVSLKPTIWISCDSPYYREFIQKAIQDIDCTRRFPVHITQHAPQPASRRLDASDSSHLHEGSNNIQNHEMSGAIWGDGGYIRRNGDQVEIRVQTSSSNHYSACGLEIKIREASGIEYVCRLGGLVRIDNVILGLTTAHAIPKSFLDDRLQNAVSKDESLFIFDSHFRGHGISAEPPSNASVSTTTWWPATLWLAEYGTSPTSLAPIAQGSSRSSATLDEDMCDFALLQIDFGNHHRPGNNYRKGNGMQVVQRQSNDLREREVDVVCSYDDVRSGWLLAGERIIVSDTGCWKTRKIQLQEPLDRGFSGTWVVSNGEAIGMIVAVYDNQPYVHMIPMASVFPSIRNALRKGWEDSEVRILRTVVNTASDLELPHLKLPHLERPHLELLDIELPDLQMPEAQPRLVSAVIRPKHRPTTRHSDCSVAAESEGEREDDVAKSISVAESVPRTESKFDIVRNLPTGLFVPISLMVLAIGLDASAFPVIMPSITDTFDSTVAMGWLGSVYLLAFGATFPLFHRLYPAICRLSNKWGTIFTLLFVSVIFGTGSVLCYNASTDALLLCGRIFCGISAAGVMSGTAFIVKELSPKEKTSREIRDACLLAVYALSRFVGQLFGAVITGLVTTERAWKYVFIMNLVVITLPIATLLACFTPYVRWNVAYCPQETDILLELQRPPVWLRLFRASFVLSSFLVTGAIICLELAVHYGALGGWSNTFEISLTASLAVSSLIAMIVRLWWVWNRSHGRSMLARRYRFHRGREEMAVMLLSSFCWGVSYHTLTYYLPFWLRAVRGYSVLGTATRYLPTAAVYLFACAVKALLFPMRRRPWMMRILTPQLLMHISLVFMALSAGLMTTFDIRTSFGMVVGLQILFSIAAGCGALQATSTDMLTHRVDFDENPLRFEDRMKWNSLAVFAEMLGGSVGISAAQTVFIILLSRGVNNSDSDLDDVLHSGVTKFRDGIGSEQLDVAVGIFNNALTKSFYVSTAAAAWQSVLIICLFASHPRLDLGYLGLLTLSIWIRAVMQRVHAFGKFFLRHFH